MVRGELCTRRLLVPLFHGTSPGLCVRHGWREAEASRARVAVYAARVSARCPVCFSAVTARRYSSLLTPFRVANSLSDCTGRAGAGFRRHALLAGVTPWLKILLATGQPAAPVLDSGGTPFSPEYGDVYHSADSGPGQARHVFLGGNDLPARWAGARIFTIVETGFGLGLKFPATWQAWRDDPARPRTPALRLG